MNPPPSPPPNKTYSPIVVYDEILGVSNIRVGGRGGSYFRRRGLVIASPAFPCRCCQKPGNKRICHAMASLTKLWVDMSGLGYRCCRSIRPSIAECTLNPMRGPGISQDIANWAPWVQELHGA